MLHICRGNTVCPAHKYTYAHDILSNIYVGTTTSNLDHMPTIFLNLQCSKDKPTCLAYLYICIYVTCYPSPFRGFLAEKGPKKPETDWDDKPGKPRLVIPVRFRVFWPKRAKKPRNGLGWEAQACHPSPLRGFLAERGQKTRNGLG